MTTWQLLIVILIIMAVSSGPWYPYSTSWGYGPFGGFLGLVLLIVLLRALGLF